MNAAETLGHLPGRCEGCGWHIQTQGHAPQCGPCTHCPNWTHRYGDGGSALCPDCRQAGGRRSS